MNIDIEVRGAPIGMDQEADLRERAGKLLRFHEGVRRVRVTVEGPGRHHRTGSYQVRVDIRVPGSEIAVSRQSGGHLGEAVKEAFGAAGRRLEDYIRKARGDVKRHVELAQTQMAEGGSSTSLD